MSLLKIDVRGPHYTSYEWSEKVTTIGQYKLFRHLMECLQGSIDREIARNENEAFLVQHAFSDVCVDSDGTDLIMPDDVSEVIRIRIFDSNQKPSDRVRVVADYDGSNLLSLRKFTEIGGRKIRLVTKGNTIFQRVTVLVTGIRKHYEEIAESKLQSTTSSSDLTSVSPEIQAKIDEASGS